VSDSFERLKAALADRYAVEREIGRGGMATVYLAQDLKHRRRVAIKVLPPELAAALGPERFLREIEVAARLQHPHILPLLDSGDADGLLYYVMPYVEGQSLRDRLTKEGELPVGEAVQILHDVVDALTEAHAHGVIHRDIKPENILLRGRHALVTDFGVAKAVSEATDQARLTTDGMALGTPMYMAPEQAVGDTAMDHRADIYAVGAVAYELLAGRPVFLGNTAQQILSAHIAEAPQPVTQHRETVPSTLAHVVMRCLEKKPADRFQTANELLAQLHAFATSTPVTPTQTPPIVGGKRVPSWAKAVGAVAVVAVAGGLWLSGVGRGTDRNAGPAGAGAAADLKRLFVMPLDNVTADSALAVWSVLAAEWIGNAIDRARPVPVVPATAVRDAIAALGDRVSVDSVAGRVAASYAVAGTLARTGNQLRFQLELLDTRTGDRLRALDPVTGPVDSVDVLVARLSNIAAAGVVATLDPDAPPWFENTSALPPSIAAYEQYLVQVDLFCRDRYEESIEVGNEVLRLAPDFYWAIGYLGGAYGNLGHDVIADSLVKVRESMLPNMTTVERAQTDWYAGVRYSDRERSVRGADEMFRLAPTALGYLAAKASFETGRASEALERDLATDVTLPCWRNRAQLWRDLSSGYHVLGRYQEELGIVRDGLERFPGDRTLTNDEARAFAGMDQVERVDSVARAMDALPQQPGVDPDLPLVLAGLELRAHGHADAGARMLNEAIARYEARPPEEDRYDRARTYYWAGRWADAEPIFAELVQDEPDDWDYLGFYGATLARQGRVEDAEAVSRTLGAMHLPWLRGRHIFGQVLIAAALDRNDEAITLLQRAFAQYYPFGTYLHIEPTFEDLRKDPRWMALVTAR